MSITLYSILFVFLLVVLAINHFRSKKEEKESFEKSEELRKGQLKKLVTERESRTIKTEFNEERFWKLIDQIRTRSKDSYKNFLGVFRDEIKGFTEEELVELDNLIIRLTLSIVNQKESVN